MQKKYVASLVIAIVLLIAISGIAFAGSMAQPVSSLENGQQVVTMTLGPGMMSGTPQPGTNGMAMGGSGCGMMGSMTGMSGMGGMSGMSASSGMAGMNMSGSAGMTGMNMTGTGTMNMASLDDTQVILSDPSTWLNNPWTLLGWLLVLVAFLAILVGIVLGVLWIVRHATPARPVG